MKNQRIHLSRGDLLFQILVYTVLGLLSLIVLYPLIYVVSASFTSPAALVAGKMYLWPVNPTVSSYKAVLRESRLWIGYKNTIFYTLLGVSINIVMTVLGAYPLSRKDLVGRKVIMTLITFTMFPAVSPLNCRNPPLWMAAPTSERCSPSLSRCPRPSWRC